MMPLHVSLTVTLQIVNTEYRMVHTSVKQTPWMLTIQTPPPGGNLLHKNKTTKFCIVGEQPATDHIQIS